MKKVIGKRSPSPKDRDRILELREKICGGSAYREEFQELNKLEKKYGLDEDSIYQRLKKTGWL